MKMILIENNGMNIKCYMYKDDAIISEIYLINKLKIIIFFLFFTLFLSNIY